MLSVINHQLNKQQIKQMATELVGNLSENGNIIEAIEILARMELLIKEIKSNNDFTEYALSEIGKYGKLHTTSSGTKIELAEVGTKYHFELCNDDILKDLESQLESIEKQIKDRKDFLKTLPGEGFDIVTTGGELVRIYPPYKTSTSSFKTTISK
jgi:septation ring formation regulator EzrA